MIQNPINFSYSQGIEYVKFIFNSFNGKINHLFPAKYIVFDINNEKDILGKAIGDIVIIYMHNILKFINTTLQYQYTITEKNINCLIFYIVIHELFHLNQDFNKYISQYSKDRLETAIEDSCNVESIEFLQRLIHIDFYRTQFNLDNFVYEYIMNIYNKVKNKIYNQNIKYHPLKNTSEKILYILNNILFNNEDNLILWIKNKKWKFIYLEYKYDGILQNGELIYLNNHFVNHDIILKMLDKLLLLMAFNKQQLKISESKYNPDPSIVKITIDILNYQPMTIISTLNEDPIQFNNI